MYPLPQIGYETVVAVAPLYKDRLYVANIGGEYVIRCASAKIENWPETFGVEVKRKG
jgi:hypothetical protein